MALFAGVYGIPADAAFEPELEAAYNTAVQGQDTLEGLNVSVTERTVSSATNLAAEKTMELKVSGIQTDTLKADIQVKSEETASESYYTDGHYYAETSDGKTKREMDRASIWQMINANTYLDLTSNLSENALFREKYGWKRDLSLCSDTGDAQRLCKKAAAGCGQ